MWGVFFSIGGATVRANDRFVACRQGQSCSSQAVHGGEGVVYTASSLDPYATMWYNTAALRRAYRVAGNSLLHCGPVQCRTDINCLCLSGCTKVSHSHSVFCCRNICALYTVVSVQYKRHCTHTGKQRQRQRATHDGTQSNTPMQFILQAMKTGHTRF